MRKLRIAFVVPRFPVISETFIVNQIIDLLDQGHDVQILAFEKGEVETQHEMVRDYNLLDKTIFPGYLIKSRTERAKNFVNFLLKKHEDIHWKKMPRLLLASKDEEKGMNLGFLFRNQWILEAGQFDVYHAHFGNAGAVVAQIMNCGFFKSSKLAVSFHGADIHPNNMDRYRRKYNTMFHQADLLIVNSRYSLSLLSELTCTNRIIVLPVGVNTNKFKPARKSSKKKIQILFVGRLVDFKGPNLAVDITSRLKAQGYNINLIIIGEGTLRRKLEQQIEKLGLEENVRITGACLQEEIILEMNRSDLFLLPGIHDEKGRAETQGLVIQEAQAMGLPVLVSSAGGMKYGLIDGHTGFVVKEKYLEGFVEKIILLIKDEKLRKQMGINGRKFVLENYDSKLLGKKMVSFYQDSCDK